MSFLNKLKNFSASVKAEGGLFKGGLKEAMATNKEQTGSIFHSSKDYEYMEKKGLPFSSGFSTVNPYGDDVTTVGSTTLNPLPTGGGLTTNIFQNKFFLIVVGIVLIVIFKSKKRK